MRVAKGGGEQDGRPLHRDGSLSLVFEDRLTTLEVVVEIQHGAVITPAAIPVWVAVFIHVVRVHPHPLPLAPAVDGLKVHVNL